MKIDQCDRCSLYAHNPYLVCAVHPDGVQGDSCLDFRPDPNFTAGGLMIQFDASSPITLKKLMQLITLVTTITFTLGSVVYFPALSAEKSDKQQNDFHLPQFPAPRTPSQESILGKTRTLNEVKGYWSEQVLELENQWEGLYEKYFDNDFSSLSLTPNQISEKLSQLSQQTGKRPAVVWMTSTPDYLALYIITPGKKTMGTRVPEANQEALFKAIQQFHQQIQLPRSSSYLKTAQNLYKSIIFPIEYYLRTENIDTLILCVGPKLRSFPFAALHDGQNFLIENYAITRIPGFNLTNWNYKTLTDAQVLAMGASEFSNDTPLPGVAAELSIITSRLWQGVTLLNDEFTLANLKRQRQTNPYSIIHLATHARFLPGSPSNSYIQFSDTRLNLNEMKELNWSEPLVSLLVLSACNTALGDIHAELGFVGLALQSGVHSAVGSLWQVSDLGTLGLMSEFYWQLKRSFFKAEALRQAQIAMIQGKVRWREGKLETSGEDIVLTADPIELEGLNLSHPYYWSGFSLVGNPF